MSASEALLPESRKRLEAQIAPLVRAGDWQHSAEILQALPYLINSRPRLNRTLLMEAVLAERPDVAEWLLQRGAQLDFISAVALGRTAVAAAMLADRPHLVRRRAPDSFSALHLAARYAGPDMLNVLLAAGADAHDHYNRRRLTPLFCAIVEPYSNAETLLAAGADINARDIQGFTVLHFAASRGDVNLVSFLLAHGSDPTSQTAARQTAWGLAVRRGHHATATLLRRC